MSDSGSKPVGESSAPQQATSTTTTTTQMVSDVLEERLIDAEYKIWKKNTPYLYDLVMTHALEWPSLTCQWLPSTKAPVEVSVSPVAVAAATTSMVSATREHSLLLGTHTTGEQNYVMVCTVNLPAIDEHGNTCNAVVDTSSSKNSTNAVTVLPASHYDEEKAEVGGFGFRPDGGASSSSGGGLDGTIEVKLKILHEGEVHRARYCPQDPFVVATKGPSPYVYIFDMSKHPSVPPPDGVFSPNFVLAGHEAEGYGLAWSSHTKGHIISGNEDAKICYWDIHATPSEESKSRKSSNLTIDPISTFTGHTAAIEDVDWHKLDPYLIGSCGDDVTIRLWDVRESNSTKATHVIEQAHGGDVHCLSFHPTNEFLLATGSADRTVALWDMRYMKS